ncbi:hypothetical protein EDD85DRAFT_809336 [Armillaria nabsnona]|nr:hypothetical protein EDD85DRAFT_809336 [Armillaria nabsnona]
MGQVRAARFQDGGKVTGDGGHIEKMRCLLKEANDAGAKITNDNFATILIDSFPESWDPVVSTLHGETDIVKIVAHLSAHGDRVAGHGGRPTSSTSTDLSNQALHAMTKNHLMENPMRRTNTLPSSSANLAQSTVTVDRRHREGWGSPPNVNSSSNRELLSPTTSL